MKHKNAGNDNFTHFSDFYQPFLIEDCHVRGSFVRFGDTITTILNRHHYPDIISKLLGEQMVLACMLSGNLKGQGALTMQVRGQEGPVKFTVVDVSANGDIRGYAELEEDADETLTALVKKKKDELTLRDFVGNKGYLAITMHGHGAQQYQGIVGLVGDTLTDALTEYFTQSEQRGVSIRVAVKQGSRQGKKLSWMASGMMVQHMPKEGGKKTSKAQIKQEEEDWNRATILMRTVTDAELLDAQLPAQTLLQRLFNEDGVWVYEPRQMRVGCRCSRERVEEVLSTFSSEDLEDMKTDDGIISVNCQFCNKTEIFREDDIQRILTRSSARP